MDILSEEAKIVRWHSSYLWLIAVFYFFQGIYFFGTGIYMGVAMGNWEVPVRVQSLVVAIIGLPTYLKIIPGLLSDRLPLGRFGRRKGYVFIGALMYVPGYATLLVVNRFGSWWIAGIMIVLIAWSFADTALDGLTVDITPNEKATITQSYAQGGRIIGVALTGLAVPILGARLGWNPVLWLLCLGALVQSVVVFLLPEPEVSRQMLRDQMPLRTVFKQAFSQPQIWSALAFALFFSAGTGVHNLVTIYLLSELGWSREPAMMTVYGVTNLIFRLSAFSGALLVMRLPHRYLISVRFYGIFVCLLWILMLPWLLFFYRPDQVSLIYLARILEGIGAGMANVLLLAIAMRVSPKSLEGFTFALVNAAGSFGDLALETNTVTAFAGSLGGIIPAFFVLFPYALVSLIFLRPVLRSLIVQESVLEPVYSSKMD